jgi:hypothetical protein
MIHKKLLTAAIIAASLSLETLPVNAGVLGGINITVTTCKNQTLLYNVNPVLVGSNPNAYSWRCRAYLGSFGTFWPSWDYSVDMTAACRNQYKNSRAFAETTNWQSPYSWRCRVN